LKKADHIIVWNNIRYVTSAAQGADFASSKSLRDLNEAAQTGGGLVWLGQSQKSVAPPNLTFSLD
jgi:hypothetical protein